MVSALLALLGLVAAQDSVCTSPTNVPLGSCTPNDEGWANVDMDSIGTTDDDGLTTGQAISIEFKTKKAHVDEDECKITTSTDCPQGENVHTQHGATQGTFTYEKINGRYVLPCKQTVGEKTIKITVSRPADMTEFGAEWVKAYEKDSWTNVTNEYEPYTFNDFGSKIPLQEFRSTTIDDANRTIVIDAVGQPELQVFMVMDEIGDYEIRYGNPNLKTSEGKWIAIEFKKHQLRVGSPWASCATPGGAATTGDSFSGTGTIIPVYLGNPSLNINDYYNVRTTLGNAFNAASANPTKLILPIFTPQNDGADRTIFPGATTWTEGTWVVNGVITADARNPLTTKNEAYHCTKAWKDTDTTPVESHPACSLMEYRSCYAAGASCPLDHDVCKPEYCELQRWREIIDLYQELSNVQTLGLVETQNADGTPREMKDIEDDIQLYKDHVPAISGFYFNEVGTNTLPVGWVNDTTYEGSTGTHIDNLLATSYAHLKTGCPKKYNFPGQLNICFPTADQADGTNGATTETDGKCGWCCKAGADCSTAVAGCTEQSCADHEEYYVVFGVGEPLFATSAVADTTNGKPDLWITLNDASNALGVWTPYSWFSSLNCPTCTNGYDFKSENWGAIVTGVTDVLDYGTANIQLPSGASYGRESILTKLFDRGYGYIYLTTESDFTTTSTELATLITGIYKKISGTAWAPPTSRRLEGERALQTLDDGVSAPQWECDDTLHECAPVCVESMGVSRSKVSPDKCPAAKPNACGCRCYYDAHWACEGNGVVCKATITHGVEMTVGDLVCATRGTPKPDWNPTAETRTAGTCEPLKVLREERPTDQCFTQWAEEKEAAKKAAEQAAAVGAQFGEIEMDLFMEAAAAVPALVAAMVAVHL